MAVNLLLVGKSGNGKSSTGNSILGKKAFKPILASHSTVVEPESENANIGKKTITVVDGLGFGDASLNDYEGVKKMIDSAVRALNLCHKGFDAVLLVLKFGERFTTQEMDSVYMMKSILGMDVMKTHGIIVMTHGDNFDFDEDEGMTFEEWCKDQTGDAEKIFKECKNRCVLFNNRTKKEEKLEAQRNQLLEMVEDMQLKGKPYTMADYNKAETDRNRLLVSSKFPILEAKNRNEIGKINAKIDELADCKNPDLAINSLLNLQKTLDKHKNDIQKETEGTDVAKNLLVELGIVEMTLTTKLNMAKAEQKLLEQQKRKSSRPPKDRTTKDTTAREVSSSDWAVVPREDEKANTGKRPTGNTTSDSRAQPKKTRKKNENEQPTGGDSKNQNRNSNREISQTHGNYGCCCVS